MAENFPISSPSGAIKSGIVPWKALSFSGVIFGTTLIVYLGLAFGYKPFIESSIAADEARMAKLDREAPKAETEAEFIQFYSQLMNITRLLSAHTAVTSFFDAFEAKTMANVGFAEMTIDVPGGTASMGGFARSYETLAGQLAVYKEIAGIERVMLSSARLADDFVRFEMKADFTPEFFKFKPPVEQPINELTVPIDNR